MVIALNAYGNIAPTKRPANTNGLITSTLTIGCLWRGLDDLVKKAPYSAKLTKAADPIANPFPIAAVVFPAASN